MADGFTIDGWDEVAKAFATFANNGKEVTPIAIRNVEDKNGNIFKNPEKTLRDQQKAKGNDAQIISPQTAYIMQEMLKKTVETGTLYYGSQFDSTYYTLNKRKGYGNKFKFKNQNGDDFIMPAAGKTGTTQNWADAWTVGFTPYYTAAFWFGFDRPGQSLGLSITGSTLAGVAWGDFMHEINNGKSYKPFVREIPEGVVRMEVCSESGQLLTQECGNHKIIAYYLAGTEPTELCQKHTNTVVNTVLIPRLEQERIKSGFSFHIEDDSDLTLNLDFLNSDKPSSETEQSESQSLYEALFGRERDEDDLEDDEEDFGNWLLQ